MFFRTLIVAVMVLSAACASAQVIKINSQPYNPFRPASAELKDPSAEAEEIESDEAVHARLASDTEAGVATPLRFSGVYDVTANDTTLREVLERWALSSGWMFKHEHWTIDRDYPIQGTAAAHVFGNDFKQAVRILLSSTELTDRAVQPCFYSNSVLRVIPLAGNCTNVEPQ